MTGFIQHPRERHSLMKRSKIISIALLFWVIITAFAVNGRILWPGEKWLEGITNVDGLKQVFNEHTSNYDRRYLIQALPYFCKDRQITYFPPWLIQAVGQAIDDPDPLIVIEGIVAAHMLNLSPLSPNLSRTYLRARQMSFEDMPTIHQTTVATLADFNNAVSRRALVEIINQPQPAVIITDVVPALKALATVGDSTSFGALDILKSRVLAIKDSIIMVKNHFAAMRLSNRADSLQAKADSTLAEKATALAVFVDRVKTRIQERTGAK